MQDSFLELPTRRKKVTAAKSFVFEVRRRVDQLRGTKTKAQIDKALEERMEKGHAAAWASLQHHGKPRNERISSINYSDSSHVPTVRSSEPGRKSSRFRTEDLETSSHSMSTLPAELGDRRGRSGHRKIESGQMCDFSNVSVSRASSLFDSYELESVSKRIDSAVQGDGSTTSLRSGGFDAVLKGEGHSMRRSSTRFPFPTRSQRPSSHYIQEVTAIPHGSQVLTSCPKVTRSSSLRMNFPGYICRSTSDVVSREKMSLGVGSAKFDRQETRTDFTTDTRGRTGCNIHHRITSVHSLPRV